MDEIYESKLTLYKRIEKIIKDIEAKTNESMEAIRHKLQSDNTSIGPANDLLRFFYILERQYQCDDDETRRKAREDCLEYIDQYRPPDDDDEQPDQSNESQQSESIVLPNQSPPAVIPPSSTVVLPSASPVKSQLPHPQPTPSLEDIGDIKPETLIEYKKLSFEAQQYEKRYSTIDLIRKKQLASCIRDIMNKLLSNQIIRISNEEERLLCLSMLASLILSQLLGGDLNDIKTEIFLPLIGILSRIPLYPKRQSTMNDKQYLEAIGYVEKQDGDQRLLETESEFLTRMNGLIRLFCKLLVSRGSPFDKDLAFAWKWFPDVLNLPPKSNITSILIRVFLDEAGEIMIKAYPAQFPKLINAVRIQYLPLLEKETSHNQITRLRLTLEKLFK
ncbi:unnamed protein product [Rotaria sp. Silwood1]|nr:unnamed protein product [Rotaria sp. Silwood1]CAF1541691.1 unnamed protein product [Rotaria sp. Silwood1]